MSPSATRLLEVCRQLANASVSDDWADCTAHLRVIADRLISPGCTPPAVPTPLPSADAGLVAQSSASSGECASKANLDLNDKLVKRGLTVSWHGYRATVQRVRTGRCLVKFTTVRSSHVGVIPAGATDQQWLPCSSVQVVRP